MMRLLPAAPVGRPLQLLCIGAHSDDIEIGCGGTLLRLAEEFPGLDMTWVVLSAAGEREAEAHDSARALFASSATLRFVCGGFLDGYLPAEFGRAKEFFASLSRSVTPDIVFTHRLEDRHQDHRVAGELTWQAFRDHWVLEYEIPKYEGDLGSPNFYVSLTAGQRDRKLDHLRTHFATQRSKTWFRDETFDAVMRLRAIECRAPEGFAEAFHARKVCF